MEILKRFLCDWGSPDSNMLLFFLLTSFLLGLLTGWLIWGRKIQAMLDVVAERDATITDINGKLTGKEADLNKANAEIDALRLKIRQHEEEKGQLRSDLYTANAEIEGLNAKLAANIQSSGDTNIVAPVMAVAAPTMAAVVAPEVAIETAAEDVDTVAEEVAEDVAAASIELTTEPSSEIAEATTPEPVVEEVLAKTAAPTEETAENPVAAAIRNDLKVVEGIGPKIEELCNNIGIYTWKGLSETPVARLQEMLDAAGKRYQIHNPGTWPEQGRMAAEGLWDELKIYQDHLKGGKEPDAK